MHVSRIYYLFPRYFFSPSLSFPSLEQILVVLRCPTAAREDGKRNEDGERPGGGESSCVKVLTTKQGGMVLLEAIQSEEEGRG